MQCVVCGKEIEKSQYGSAVLCGGECFKKHYWNDIISEREKHIIINGDCYYDAGNMPDSYTGFLGHSGRKFYIKYFDGRIMSTNNLWYNGTVPEEFRNQLKDNATFCAKAELIKGGVTY